MIYHIFFWLIFDISKTNTHFEEEKRMKNKKILLAILAIALVLGMTLVGCKDSPDIKKIPVTITYSLDKVDASTFTMTIEGSSWDYYGYPPSIILSNVIQGRLWDSTDPNTSLDNYFTITETSETVITCVLKPEKSGATGTLYLDERDKGHYRTFTTTPIEDASGIYVVTANIRNGSITF
jgi:hypothetical protein